jgi:hypothetical protein
MKKLPVLEIIKAAYRFVFTHLGSIIGLIWLPMVLITVAGFFAEQQYLDAAAGALLTGSSAKLGSVTLGLIFFFIAWLLFNAIMYVPVVQLALGKRKGDALIHFAFGPAEWRMFRAITSLVGFLLLPALTIGLLVNSLLYFGLRGHALPAPAIIGIELLVLVVYLGLAYVGLRFVFLLPSVAVQDEGPVLPRAWKLSAGNFWRILAILLGTMAPVAIVAGLGQALLEGPQAMMPVFGASGASSAMAAAQLHVMSMNMPLTQGIGFLVAPLLLGLAAGASAAAFTALQANPLQANAGVTDI